MRIDPALLALRSGLASQRAAQAALERAKADWRGTHSFRPVLSELRRFASGAALADCMALGGMLSKAGDRAGLVNSLIRNMLPVIAANPLGQVPFRHQYSGGVAIMQLAAAGDAAISLVMYERRTAAAAPQTVCFTDTERHEVVLAGSGLMQIIRRQPGKTGPSAMSCSPLHITRGQRTSLCGMSETKFIDQVADRLVVLRLSRTAVQPRPSLEFRLDDGTLVHRASGSKSDSRHEIMVSLLGRMGRRDAAPVLAEMTIQGSDHLRWQALRECLALDTAHGFAALSAMADDPGDPLSFEAHALRSQLIETHPQLTEWLQSAETEERLCRA